MTKNESLKKQLNEAIKRLGESLEISKTDIIRDSVVQRFEFVFELFWKFIQSEIEGSDRENLGYGPKNVIKGMARCGLIDDVDMWLGFLELRNLAVHTYSQKVAEEIYVVAGKFLREVEKVMGKV